MSEATREHEISRNFTKSRVTPGGFSPKSASFLPDRVQCSSFQGPKPFMALCGCICFTYGMVRYLKIDFLSPLEKNEHSTRPGSEANFYPQP